MGAPYFFGSMAVFWPGPRMHPEPGGEGYCFCETTDIGQDGTPETDGSRYYKTDKRITARTRKELEDLQNAVRWALLHEKGESDDDLDLMARR